MWLFLQYQYQMEKQQLCFDAIVEVSERKKGRAKIFARDKSETITVDFG